jgi:hypothetical protein
MTKAAESHNDKPKNHVEEAANKTVEETKKQLEKSPGGDTHGAYNKLIESVRTTHEELDKKDKTGKSAKEYEQAVVQKLEKEKLLPTFALEYGQRAFEKIDHKSADTGHGNGQLTKAELKAFQATGRPGEFGKAMTESLIQQSDSIKANDPRKQYQEGITQIDMATGVRNYERTQEFQKSNQQKAEETKLAQGEAKQLQSFLFDEKDGKPSIIRQADFAGSSDLASRQDGKVVKRDFEALVADPRLSESEKKDIQEKIIAKWDDPKFQARYLENGQMSAETFKKATGAEDAAAAEKAKQEALAKEKQAEEGKVKEKTEAQFLDELLRTKVNDATIHQAADFAGSDKFNERTDKLVNKKDLQAFINSSPTLDEDLSSEIKGLLINKMDDPAFARKYMNGEYLDLEKISKAAGAGESDSEAQTLKSNAESAKQKQEQEKIDAQAQELAKEREQSIKLAEALIDVKGGDTLLGRADWVGSSDAKNRTDGLVTKGDLEALTADPTLSTEKRDFIKNNLLGKNWDTPAVKNLREGDYISVDSLKTLLPNS